MAKKFKLKREGLFRLRTEQLGVEYVAADTIEEAIEKVYAFSKSLEDPDLPNGEEDVVLEVQDLGRVVR